MAIQGLADLSQRLEHMRPGALGRTAEAPANRLVVQDVDLALGEGQSLIERETPDDPLHQRSGLAREQLGLRGGISRGTGGGAYLAVGPPAASL